MTAWARRDDPARLAEAVTRFRAAATAAPDRVDLQLRLADALYLQADGVHRFGRDYHAMRRGFAESTRAAERAVAASNPGFVRAACAGRGWKRAVALLERKDVPAVYLWIAALGKTGLSESVLTILGRESQLLLLGRRLQALDPTFHHGAVHRFFGAYWAKVPFPEGRLDRSRRHFERAIAASPDFLANRVLMARLLATRLGDRALFESQLRRVLATSPGAIAALSPEQRVEQRKARLLLEQADWLFAAPQPTVARTAAPATGWFSRPPTHDGASGMIPGHRVTLIRNGERMNDHRFRLVARAQRSLYITAFAWKNDHLGLALARRICRRIKETDGTLEVKILLEHFGSKELLTGTRKLLFPGGLLSPAQLPRGAKLLRSCGAKVLFYRPRRRDLSLALHVRHEKLFIADARAALTGGSNIGDSYHTASPHSGIWYDLDASVEGPVACWYHNQFQRSWRGAVSEESGLELDSQAAPRAKAGGEARRLAKARGLHRMRACDQSSAPHVGPTRVYAAYGRPAETDDRPLLGTYLAAIAEARHTIRLYAPYFVPHPSFAAALVDARKRGVRVTVLTNSPESLDENTTIFSAMVLSVIAPLGGRQALVRAGVRIRLWSKRATLHRKGGIFDAGHPGEKVYLGSDNLDVRGQEMSSESILWTDDARIVRQLARDYDRDRRASRRLTRAFVRRWLASERKTPAGQFRLLVAERFRSLF